MNYSQFGNQERDYEIVNATEYKGRFLNHKIIY